MTYATSWPKSWIVLSGWKKTERSQLACRPEDSSRSGEEVNDVLYIDRATCTGCAVCLDVCTTSAISLDEREGVATIDQVLCTECLACLDVCPTGAIQRAESYELVPAGGGDVIEGQVLEGQVMPTPASSPLVMSRQPSRLATLAATALTSVGSWLLPRAADAFLDAVERRLTRGTNSVSFAPSLHAENRPQMRGTGRGRDGQGRQRRRRRRGK
jgi:ferredoxin